MRFSLASFLAAFGKSGNGLFWPRTNVGDSVQLTAASRTKVQNDHVRARRSPPLPRRLCTFAVVPQLSQPDFVPCIKPDPTLTEARCSIDITSRRARWTKDDLRAGVELGIVAAIGVIVGWVSGFGVFVGLAAALALFWLSLGVALQTVRVPIHFRQKSLNRVGDSSV